MKPKPNQDKNLKEIEMKIGKIHPPHTMFFRVHVGKANLKNKPYYEMSTAVGGSMPILHCLKTEKWFTLSWDDIIKLAEAQGINKKDNQ